MPNFDKLNARIAEMERRKQEAEVLAPPPNQPPAVETQPTQFHPGMWAAYADALPDIEGHERPAAEFKIDEVINKVDILEAYERWCGKMHPNVGNKRENIMISCPMPGHTDRNPSAAINTDKQTWMCYACEQGGDKYTIAAIKFGFDLSTYQDGQNFGELRRAMGKDLGLQFDFQPGIGYTVWAPPTEAEVRAKFTPPEPLPSSSETSTISQSSSAPSAEPAQPQLPVEVPPTASVPPVPLTPEPVTPSPPPEPYVHEERKYYYEDDKGIPFLEWENIVTPGTFLDSYMRACCVDDVAEEYHFWHGMIALSLVCGRNVYMIDSPPVFSNIFVVLLGTTATGKSKSKRHMTSVLRQVAPYDERMNSTGVQIVPTAASAETIISSFSNPIYDPNPLNKKTPVISGYHPVKGLIDLNEFKALMQRIQRSGSTMDTTLLQFYDSDDEVNTKSQTRGLIVAHKPHASLLTTVQPEVLAELLTAENEDSGFLNRFIFVGGPKKPIKVYGAERPNLADAISKLSTIRRWGQSGQHLPMTDGARDMLQKAFDDYIYRDLLAAGNAFSRVLLMIKKLALILAINEMYDKVDEYILSKVFQIYPYLLRFVKMRAAKQIVNIKSEAEELILQVLAKYFYPKQGETTIGATAGQIRPKINARKRPPIDQTNKMLFELARAGILEAIQVPSTTGRALTKYWFRDQETFNAYFSA
jgi:hypothetical protein